MALKVWDGFDHYRQSSDVLSRSGFLQYTGAGGGLTSGAGRNGNGKAWAGSLTATFAQRVANALIGASLSMAVSDVTFVFEDTIANTAQVTVVFRSRNYTIEVYRGTTGGTLIYRSANNVWGAGPYNFVEIWPVIDNSSGSVKVHINQIELVSITGVDTQATANAWWDQVQMSGYSALDDFYYCDSTVGDGSNPCNSFIGDPRVYTQFPTANAAVQFTPLTGANWQEVSEVQMDSDTSYNIDGTVGHEDLFNIGAVPTTITGILGLQVIGAYRKDDAGFRSMKNALKSNTTEVYGTVKSLPDGSYAYIADPYTVDPDTGVDWIRAGVNAAEIGYNIDG